MMKKHKEDLLKDAHLVVAHGKIPATTSINIADKFEKRHADVIRSIENLECSKEFTERNFALSEYIDSTGRKLPMYIVTRDGFAFLAMGFTGKTSAYWKEQYITSFNMMEEILRRQMQSSWQERRRLGKDVRLSETDVIKIFIGYAKAQGSTNANYYYVNCTTATYRALFYFPDKGGWKEIRDILDGLQLAFLQSAEYVFKRSLEYGMSKEWHYKEIFQYAQKEILEITTRFGPKTYVPSKPELDYSEKLQIKGQFDDVLLIEEKNEDAK